MGDSKRRKLLDQNFGKLGEWQARKTAQQRSQTLLEDDDLDLSSEIKSIHLDFPGKKASLDFKVDAETVPMLLFHDLLDCSNELLRQACIEYWQKHDFDWIDCRCAAPQIVPPDCKSFLSKDLPGDMATALSLDAFREYVTDGNPEGVDYLYITEKHCRQWCQTVCSIGKAMQIVSQQGLDLENDDLYVGAIQFINLTHGPIIGESEIPA